MNTDTLIYSIFPYCNIKSILNCLILSHDFYTIHSNNTFWKMLTDRDYRIIIYYIYCINNNLQINSSIPSYYIMFSVKNIDENIDENIDDIYNNILNTENNSAHKVENRTHKNNNTEDNTDNTDNTDDVDRDNIDDADRDNTDDVDRDNTDYVLNFIEIYKFMYENHDKNKIFLHQLFLKGVLKEYDLNLLNVW